MGSLGSTDPSTIPIKACIILPTRSHEAFRRDMGPKVLEAPHVGARPKKNDKPFKTAARELHTNNLEPTAKDLNPASES